MQDYPELIALLERITVALETIAQKMPPARRASAETPPDVPAELGNNPLVGNNSGNPVERVADDPDPVSADPASAGPIGPEEAQEGWEAGDEQALEDPPSTERIVAFLEDHGIQIKAIRPEEDYDDVLDNIAVFIGTRYSAVQKVYNLIKRNMNYGGSFRMYLREEDQDVIGASTQLCTRLYRIAFLEKYEYLRSPRYLLTATTTRLPTALNFYAGGWLERYVKCTMQDVVNAVRTATEAPIDYAYLANSQIVLPNGDDFELDFLAQVGDEIFWIEAKTGEYQRHIAKYSKMANLLELGQENTFMVLVDISESQANDLSSLFGMQVVAVESFPEVLKENLMSRYV